MEFVKIATEQTTAATDLLSAFVVLFIGLSFASKKNIRIKYWMWFYIFFGIASFAGAIAHGVLVSAFTKAALWQIIYFSLGVCIAYLIMAALPIRKLFFFLSMLSGILFYLFTVFVSESFLSFVVYASTGFLISLIIHARHYFLSKNKAILLVLAGIVVIILSGLVQALFVGELKLIFVFDHNGLSHIVQMIGMIIISLGIFKTVEVVGSSPFRSAIPKGPIKK